jgi:hypothetical protein
MHHNIPHWSINLAARMRGKERHAAISRLNFLTGLPGNLGHVDLLSIYGHQRKAGKYEQVIH